MLHIYKLFLYFAAVSTAIWDFIIIIIITTCCTPGHNSAVRLKGCKASFAGVDVPYIYQLRPDFVQATYPSDFPRNISTKIFTSILPPCCAPGHPITCTNGAKVSSSV